MTMRSWTLVMVPLFSVSDPHSVKLTIFKIWPYLKLSIFSQQLISPKLFYFGNPRDLGNDVGDFFAHKVMQIPNLETVFKSELIWNFKNYRIFVISWFDLIYCIQWFSFRFAKIFQFFVVAPHQRFFEISEKVEFLHDNEELGIDYGTVIFSECSSFKKANNFFNLTQFKIIDF